MPDYYTARRGASPSYGADRKMRIAATICGVAVALLAAGSAAGTRTAAGTLAGTTKIDNGCPVMTPGGNCHPWRPFPHAHFTVTRLTSAGAPIPATTHKVESNAAAAFRIVLRPGSYLIQPSAGRDTKGGATLRVHVAARRVTTAVVRFTAKIQPV